MTEDLTEKELMEALAAIRRLRQACELRGDQEGYSAMVLAHRVVLEAAAEKARHQRGANESKTTT